MSHMGKYAAAVAAFSINGWFKPKKQASFVHKDTLNWATKADGRDITTPHTSAELSQVSTVLSWAAVAELGSQGLELLLSRPDLFYVLCREKRDGIRCADQTRFLTTSAPLPENLLWMRSRASSLVRVIFCSRQEDGRRDWLCFTRRWEQRTWGFESRLVSVNGSKIPNSSRIAAFYV